MGLSEGLIEIQEQKTGDVFILRLKGRLDAISTPLTEKKIFDYINEGHYKILLDFAQVDYISSAGMRMLLSLTKKLKSLSGKLVLCNVTHNVMDVLKMSGFDHVLELTRSEEDALKKF
jgi:anti-sigma B factor antagonist/stage II sporulation protein AA (anti-sigma F factor antagonist)